MLDKLKPYLLLLPAMTVLLGLFAVGIISALAQSLGYFPIVGLKEVTLKYYIEVLSNTDFMKALLFSLYISFVSSVIAVIIGVFLAYLVTRSKYKNIIEAIVYKLPIIVPHIVVALLVFNILSMSGFLPRLLFKLGIIEQQSEFPNLVFDKKGIGIIIAYIWKGAPFVAMVVYTVLDNLNKKLSEVALNLGANKRQVFWHVILPLLMPSISSCFLIIFAFSFGAFELPYLLGPTYPKALPVMAYTNYMNPDLTNRPYTMVISMMLTFIALVCILLYIKFYNKITEYNR